MSGSVSASPPVTWPLTRASRAPKCQVKTVGLLSPKSQVKTVGVLETSMQCHEKAKGFAFLDCGHSFFLPAILGKALGCSVSRALGLVRSSLRHGQQMGDSRQTNRNIIRKQDGWLEAAAASAPD
jgi:hypothetical protein